MIELIPLPPEEAIAYFEQKGYAIGFDHRDVWQQEHQAGFTVAKVMQQDILEDIRKAADAAIKDGTPFAQFSQQLTPILQDKGWWGQRPMTDPLTGIERDVQLGSPRRLKTIYDTNLRTAHSEGQWAGGRRASLNQHLIEKLESVQPPMSRASVADLVNGPAFADWLQAPAGNFPIAHLGNRTAAKQGAKTQLAVMPERTLVDQLQAEQPLPPSAYDWVQKAIDEGIQSKDAQSGTVIYTLEESGYTMIVELGNDGNMVTLESFRQERA